MLIGLRKLIPLTLGILLVALWTPASHAETVVIVSSDSLTSTSRTISGARSAIRNEHENANILCATVSPSGPDGTAQLDSIRRLNPDILVTVGSVATQTAKGYFPDIPIVFSSVMYPVISGFVESLNKPGERITGASLDIPIDIQFRYFRQIIPDMSKVGVMYTSNTASLIPPARVVASEMDMELVAIEINDPRDIPRALDSLTKATDGIWSLADMNLFDPQSTRYILLNSLRRGVPFMGFSRYVVESGALFALDFDYKAIGRQAGRIVNSILDGVEPGNIPVTTPDIIWFHYNEKTAEHVNIRIPPDLVAIAKEVYR